MVDALTSIGQYSKPFLETKKRGRIQWSAALNSHVLICPSTGSKLGLSTKIPKNGLKIYPDNPIFSPKNLEKNSKNPEKSPHIYIFNRVKY